MSGTNRGAQRSDQRTPQRIRPNIVIATAATRFNVDLSRKPDGMSYAWRALKVMGKEQIEHQIMLEQNGWTPVPPERHPELTGSRFVKSEDNRIIRGDQCLMERPEEITKYAQDLDTFAAKTAVTDQLTRLKLMGHREGGKGIKRTIGPAPNVVDDD